MIPSPRRAASTPAVHTLSEVWDDDEGWQDMPVVRSEANPFGLDDEDQKKYHYQVPTRLEDDPSSPNPAGAGNATGAHLELESETAATGSWRAKIDQDESDYTRLRLDEDEESEEVHMRTRYLFDEDKAMTPLSQMQATKELLTEGQRIAYVGLCQLIMRRMLRDMGRGWEGYKAKKVLGIKGGKSEVPVVESGHIWMLKIMARLYQHMELSKDEQRMIESLAEHGVDPSDLVPALMTTHTVNNPDYDPQEKQRADLEEAGIIEQQADDETLREEKSRRKSHEAEEVSDTETEAPPPYSRREQTESVASTQSSQKSLDLELSSKPINPFGFDDDDETDISIPAPSFKSLKSREPLASTSPKSVNPFGWDDEEDVPPPSTIKRTPSSDPVGDDSGDIGGALSPPLSSTESTASPLSPAEPSLPLTPPETAKSGDEKAAPAKTEEDMVEKAKDLDEGEKTPKNDPNVLFDAADRQAPAPLPSLPGVSTSLSTTDQLVTLDIRWTILCDLFLVLIADAVFDARSRTFLTQVAAALGFDWLDVVRFENRVTEALEIQEGMEKKEQKEIIDGRKKAARNKRYAMMGAAALGGGLVIGLSAGLMAPLIGAGLGAAFTTVGITGTTGFLAGAGGAAVITTGGVLTGANIAGRGMARRTREVRTFQMKPLHNNKRVSCYITMGGFMASKVDDVRLPFSVLDPSVGDVFSILWEPEMMEEMGGALKIFGSEILTQVGQQVLQATVMTALLSALQWPLILTKLGYLIDNPWSNALDRARAAGLLLADVIMQRHAGVRPISLIGFSLGARAIFYALIELARNKAFGLVQDVFIFGTTVTASRTTWLDVRSVVAGRFVNGYATNDWMLGYLFRATSGGLNTVAGLRPVESVQGLENVDVTELITGHMSYRSCMPQLLKKVGFPVTAEYFDEPEDPDVDMSVQERTIVNEAEEEAKKNRRKILGIFPVKQTSASNSGQNTPNAGASTPTTTQAAAAGEYELEDDDDLPPREEVDIGELPSAKSHSPASGMEKEATDAEDAAQAERARAVKEEEDRRLEAEEVKAIPKTAGFDFQAISRELGKDIDVDKLREPEPRKLPPLHVPLSEPRPLERSGSAPPPHDFAPPPVDDAWSSTAPDNGKSSKLFPAELDDGGDISGNTYKVRQMSLADDMPSWGNPEPVTTPSPDTGHQSSSTGSRWAWNTWGSSSSATGTSTPGLKLPKAAPPAKPHPPEFLNAWGESEASGGFASSMEVISGMNFPAGYEANKKRIDEERMAEENPW
ncbi:hypothetical protein I350_05312 [Cryptococcus amylolentus CBS 6273]|uniref:DUF726-domain-containing protein n=1 Tax=Cryptococcus amylolentus CBS 6273 TaxID=1296118 RepID=A0A1E3JV55_9TREE|nr:hypothetical protein I350_05312 [Cryptococcus amylolentus CBS 6273]